MNIRLRNALVLITLIFAMPASSSETGQSSPDWVDQYVDAQLCNTTLDQSQFIPQKFLKHVLKAYRVYLDQAKLDVTTRLKEARPDLKVRNSIPFRGQEFPVLAVLGMGTSGIFYVVQTPDGIRTAEEFFDHEVAQRVGHFKSRADIHIYDHENNFVIEEFVMGLPEYRLAKGEELVRLGVTSIIIARQISAWMMARVTVADGQKHNRDDVLVEIPTGRVVELFPYPKENQDVPPAPSIVTETEEAGEPTPGRSIIFE